MESKKRTLQTMSPLKIGNVEMQNPLVLAPMAGVTDLPFRVLCKEQGAGLICMEMVSAKAILYKNKNTEDLMTIHPGEHPVSLQLFGSDPEILAQIAAQIEERPFDILDFNMGCPVPKVVNNGEGSALMKDPALVRKIVTGMVKAVKKPVTVKIRKGFNEESANAVEIAKILEDCGVAAIAVHGLYSWCDKNVKANGQPYDLYRDGLKIYTTVNATMQRYAEQAVWEQMGETVQPMMDRVTKARGSVFSDISKDEREAIMRRAKKNSDRYRQMKRAGATDAEIDKAFATPVPMRVFSYKGNRMLVHVQERQGTCG